MKKRRQVVQVEGNSICKVKKERLASKGLEVLEEAEEQHKTVVRARACEELKSNPDPHLLPLTLPSFVNSPFPLTYCMIQKCVIFFSPH